jgi:hypothetical protein
MKNLAIRPSFIEKMAVERVKPRPQKRHCAAGGLVMGMHDRDWYREKQIDWKRGGLKQRNAKRRRFPKYLWWVLVVFILVVAAALFRLM